MAHPWKGRFTPKICKTWLWRMMIFSASKKSWNVKEMKSWCEGKVGQISLTLGSTKEFYVQVESNASTEEFPDNASNKFKNRLPNVLVFRELGWNVGLSSITLPMSNRTVRSGSNQKRMNLTNPFSFRFIWYEGYTEDSKRGSEHSVEIYDYGHQAVFANSRSLASILRSGRELMNEIRNRYLWAIGFKQRLVISSNMTRMIMWSSKRTTIASSTWRHTSRNNWRIWWTQLWKILLQDEWRLLVLEYVRQLRFHGFGSKFRRSVWWSFPHRLPHTETSLVITGDKVTDLLREMPYNPEEIGYEPKHIQYIPLCSDMVDIIEVQMSESDGSLVNFEMATLWWRFITNDEWFLHQFAKQWEGARVSE